MNKILIVIFILLIPLYGCDNRKTTQTLSLSSYTNQAYINDDNSIGISCKFNSDSNYNQKIYFKTDNGHIRRSYDLQWVSQDSIVTINTDTNGMCYIQFKHPTTLGYAKITA